MSSLPLSLVFKDLLGDPARLRQGPGWEQFRPGIRIRHLFSAGDDGPQVALLWYDPGARTPRHEHPGHEYVYVLDGAQSDEYGVYPAGTFVVNLPGKVHQVASEAGCLVLIIWEKGVRFLS